MYLHLGIFYTYSVLQGNQLGDIEVDIVLVVAFLVLAVPNRWFYLADNANIGYLGQSVLSFDQFDTEGTAVSNGMQHDISLMIRHGQFA